MTNLNKKGFSMQQALPIAIVLIIAIIVFSIGSDILSGFRDTYDDDYTAQSYGNDTTIAMVNGTVAYLGHQNIESGSEKVYNNTGASAVENLFVKGTNYNIDYVSGTLTGLENDSSQTLSNVSYTWRDFETSFAYNNTQQGLKAIDEMGNWMPTVAIIVVASIIIGLLMYWFGNRRE